MVLIHGTNILVDDFNPDRPNRDAYIYFLTHFHHDYYQGLDKTWKNERIYCSSITKDLLHQKFPNLENLNAFEIDFTNTIYIDKKKTIYVNVTFFDANHCIGSVMILFNGYMGTILHTGDFRYSSKMLTELTLLYPPSERNSQNAGCSIHIDELILDDTYCDPIFKFPKRNQAFKAIVKVIDKNPGKKFCIAIDKVGKEELLVHLATHYKIQCVVDEAKYHTLNLAKYYTEYFTMDPAGSFLHAIAKSQIKEKLKEGAIVFVPTGWCNDVCVELEPNYYVVGYSLHCNFDELSDFVNSIRPAKITPQSSIQHNRLPLEKLEKSQLNQFQCYKNMKQSGLQVLANKYCDHLKLSSHYLDLLDINILGAIQEELGLDSTDPFAHGNYSNKGKSKKQKSKKIDTKTRRDQSKQESRPSNVEEGDEDQNNDKNELLDVVEIEEDPSQDPYKSPEIVDITGSEEEAKKDATKLWRILGSKNKKKPTKSAPVELTQEDQEIIDDIEPYPKDYIPFSDGSDHSDHEEGAQSSEEEMEEESFEVEEMVFEKETDPHKVYTGMITLTITSKQRGDATELREAFSMYTYQNVQEFRIPRDMNFEEVVPYSDVLPFVEEIQKPRELRKDKENYMVLGWVESQKRGVNSLFIKLGEHMRKHNIIRRYRVSEMTVVNFLHPSQIKRKFPEKAVMVFLVVSSNIIV